MADLKIAFSTLACPTWHWADVVKHGSAFGYQGVEIRQLGGDTNLLAVPDLEPGQWPARRCELDAADFQVAGLAASIRLDFEDPVKLAEQFDIGQQYAALAAALGATFIRVFGDILPAEGPPRQARLRQIADGLKRLGDLGEPHGIDFLLETHGDFSASPPCVDLFALVDHPRIGLVWDTHHPWRFFNEPLADTWQALRKWVRHTHWKDSVLLPERPMTEEQRQAAISAGSLMAGHRHADYVLFGGGEFPATECLGLLLDAGYDGWHSLEWEKMWHPELVDPEVALPLFPGKLRDCQKLLRA